MCRASSARPRANGCVAQSVEQRSPKPPVARSSRAAPASTPANRRQFAFLHVNATKGRFELTRHLTTPGDMTMRAPATAEVPCPACGEPITLALGFELAEPEPGATTAPVFVRPLDVTERAQEHGEVCPVWSAGGGRDE